ncbi:hypothetical protein BOTBODRAFT_174921 [Botryobasidium botryosum FD-172 SS1]|uniref:Non-haem dioxygenase N-terminal domain-containing protein n=1 Tax=Botryobasidium botryosum (strain FD-172 SS1) TaxID=930990 RepID=A0A067MHA9_BOTB1|nr:hypothetical protein BOTBODRAFT_174921 [Botryobasidium botryosum FD-172 SS1]
MTAQSPISLSPEGAVVVSYTTLLSSPESLHDSIKKAFGSEDDCLGIIIVKDLPATYPVMRERLLRLADRFASLDDETKNKYVDAKSRYSFGWSHGREIMNGKPDTLKGSYYANPIVDIPTVSAEEQAAHPEYYGNNIWPHPHEKGIEGFEEAFKDLGRFIFNVGCQLAGACQVFASTHLADLSLSLKDLIASSGTTKARLLHYFPPSPSEIVQAEDESDDSWCGTHLDHSFLTGLCSALYLAHPSPDSPPEIVPSPSPSSGLYIRTRGGKLVKVAIPPDALAFQTGEGLEIATAGRLRATPHSVRVGFSDKSSGDVSRETFALFMQPETTQVISETETFGQFSKRVFDEHYEKEGM